MALNLFYKVILSALVLSEILADPIPIPNDEKHLSDYEDEALYDDVSAPGNEDVYASEFPHGQPLEKFQVETHADRASARSGRAHVRIIHKWAKPKNYAKKYRTWMPAKEWIKPLGQKVPKRLGGMSAPPRPRKTGHRRNSPPKRRKVKPSRGNHLQKPLPPPEPEYDYLSDEEYFPEESKRNDLEYHERRPPSVKRRRKAPKPNIDYRPGPKEDGSVSYSNFVQHPVRPTASTIDYTDFYEEDSPRPKDRRRKKKKRKNPDRKRIRDHEEDQYGAYSESSEENHLHAFSERYPPYYDETPQKRPLRQSNPTQPSPIYGDGYLGNQVTSTKVPKGQGVIRGFDDGTSGPGRYRNDMRSEAPQTFGQQYYEPTGYNNFGVSNNYPQSSQRDIVTQQNYQQYQNSGVNQNAQQQFNNIQVSPPNYNAINSLNQQVAANDFNRPVSYNENLANRPHTGPAQTQNAHTYQNVPNSHHEFSSRYKSNSFFDNTETFHDFNQNVHLQEEKKFGAKPGRPTNFVPSREYQEPGEAEDEFINRHLDLYSNGMNGVPIQGDGFGNDKRPKDYDIGYGELQYDENGGQ